MSEQPTIQTTIVLLAYDHRNDPEAKEASLVLWKMHPWRHKQKTGIGCHTVLPLQKQVPLMMYTDGNDNLSLSTTQRIRELLRETVGQAFVDTIGKTLFYRNPKSCCFGIKHPCKFMNTPGSEFSVLLVTFDELDVMRVNPREIAISYLSKKDAEHSSTSDRDSGIVDIALAKAAFEFLDQKVSPLLRKRIAVKRRRPRLAGKRLPRTRVR